jgi:hypothetical protein
VYLLGFDMGPDPGGGFNNIYMGTEFYKPPGSTPTFSGNWIRQLLQIARGHRSCTFIRVMGDTTAAVPEFDDVPNIQHIQMPEFLARINTAKDL